MAEKWYRGHSWWRSRRTFGLDLLTVGRNNDTLDLVQLHVLGDLSETHDQAPLGLGLVGILLVHSLLEANQLLQQKGHALVDLLAEDLVAVPGENQQQSHSIHFKLSFAANTRGTDGQNATAAYSEVFFTCQGAVVLKINKKSNVIMIKHNKALHKE